MEQKTGLFMKIGTGVVLFLAIGFIAVVVVVLFRPNQNAQKPITVPLSIQEEEDIPDENAISEPDSDTDTEDYEIYVVQRGATLSVIAKAYSMEFRRTITVQEIKDANDMKNDALTPGQELKIPKR